MVRQRNPEDKIEYVQSLIREKFSENAGLLQYPSSTAERTLRCDHAETEKLDHPRLDF